MKTEAMDRLNRQQQDFVRNIHAGMLKGEAAEKAGYSKKTAAQNASRLLKLPYIKDALSELSTAGIRKSVMDRSRALERLSEIAESDDTKHADVRACIAELAKLENWYTEVEEKEIEIKVVDEF